MPSEIECARVLRKVSGLVASDTFTMRMLADYRKRICSTERFSPLGEAP
jgi:hypothetical protein